MLKASSLLYAIYICVVISILTGILIYIFTVNKTFYARQSVKEQLIDRCDSCINYALASKNSETDTNDFKLFDDGIQCQLKIERWGMYEKLMGKAFFKYDTIHKSYLLGETVERNNKALYMCDFGEELKIAGSTTIIGDVRLPKRRYKAVNVLGNQYEHNPKIKGNITVSSQELPKIKPLDVMMPESFIEKHISTYKNDREIFNAFNKPTLVLYLDESSVIQHKTIKGNVIILSEKTIVISSTATLEDVIIKAPKVIIEKEVKATVQIYAEQEVEVESDVTLMYPSSIVINKSRKEIEKKINIGENVEIYGAVIMNGQSFQERQNNHITVGKETVVYGDVYCNGIMELKGTIIGTLFAHKIQSQTQSSKYADLILNGTINAHKLPKNFVRLPLVINPNNNSRFEQIKNIQ